MLAVSGGTARSGFALQGRAPRRTGDPISWSNVKLSQYHFLFVGYQVSDIVVPLAKLIETAPEPFRRAHRSVLPMEL